MGSETLYESQHQLSITTALPALNLTGPDSVCMESGNPRREFDAILAAEDTPLSLPAVALRCPMNSKQNASTRVLGFAFALAFVALPAWAGSKYKVLHSFTHGHDGGYPQGPPTLDRKGNLYGAAGGGGGVGCAGNGCGVIYELTLLADGKWQEQVLHEFAGGADGAFPSGSPVFDTDGNLFGALEGDAGAARSGIFELSGHSHGWQNTLIHSPGGCCPVPGPRDTLYGAIGQGKYQCGAIGELSPGSSGWSYTLLYSFCSQKGGADGWDPLAPLSWDAKGNLYGTTYFGGNSYSSGHLKYCLGSSGCGVAFQMTHNRDGSWTYHVLHRFANFKTDGQYPYGGLTVDANGNVYGTTTHGGKYDSGTVFELTPIAGGRWKQTVLYDFPNIYLGGAPGSNLLFDKAGNLYGVAGGGDLSCPQTCGVIFKLTPQAGGKWNYSLAHKFNGTDGDGPNGLTMDGAGNLYGTTMSGGQYNYGVAFELTP
jgi:uncharacterized repeat protein (TIGR03803 family)